MSIETIYLKAEQNEAFEEGMAKNDSYIGCTVAEDRRTFLTTLAQAVGRSEAIITVGQLPLLASVLSRGLGAELTAVDWNSLGLEPQEGVLLPQGALPLVIDGRVAGMILENSGQCIISVNDENEDINRLCELYVLPYLDALYASFQTRHEETAQQAPQQETQPENTPYIEQIQPLEEAKEPNPDLSEPEGNVDKIDVKTPITVPESIHRIMQDKPVDIFADMDMSEEEIEKIVPPRDYHVLRNFIIFIFIIALLAGGGWYGYDKYLAVNQYDKVYKQAVAAYTENKADKDVFSTKHFNYNEDFTSLYKLNDNIIAWLDLDGTGVSLPVVTSYGRSDTYYDGHLFDKTFNPYGTAFIKGIFDKSNQHVNLVVYGKSKDDTRLFSVLPKYLDSAFALENHTFRLRTVYEDQAVEWEIFSVLQFKNDDSPYLSNMTGLTATQRQQIVAQAIEQSKINFSVDTVSFLNDMGTYRYVTLVTQYDGQYLAVMARNIEKNDNGEVTKKPSAETVSNEGSTESKTQTQN